MGYRKILLMMVLYLCCGNSARAFVDFSVPENRPSQHQWCFDYADVLSPEIEEEINDQGRSMYKNFDVDFVVVILDSIGEDDITEYAVDMFTRWEIGKSTQGKKGILILIAKKEQKVRIEVGYDLEGIYTDAYVGQVERDILKEFLEQAEWGVGFSATIESFLFRVINNDQMQEVSDIAAPDDQLPYYSQGAGASNTFDFGAALNRPLPDNYDQIREYFSAQPTPKAAFERYMELCAKAVKHNNDLTLFTDLSNEFWKDWKHTSGQSRQEAQEVNGRSYFIKIKDNHAVVFFPAENAGKMKKSPMYFLYKSDDGWQIDIATMTRCIRVGGPGYMMMTSIFHAYSEIIMEEYNLATGFLKPWKDESAFENYFIFSAGQRDDDPNLYVGIFHEELSKLKNRDQILAIDGEKITYATRNRFFNKFRDARTGDSFKIDFIRDGRKMTVTETVTGPPDGFRLYRPCLEVPRQWLGVYMIQSLDKEWRQTMAMRDQGKFRYSSLCEIIDVYPGSPADRAGLKVRDLIVDYGVPDDNGEIMPYDVIKRLYSLKRGTSITFTVVRNLKDIFKITVTPEETMHRGYF